MTNDFTCYTCGKAGHVASSCPDTHAWTDCAECGKPGHPQRGEISRDGAWFCLDCRDPGWRIRLPAHDPRHRAPGAPLSPQVIPETDRPAPPLINEPGDLRRQNVDQMARELSHLRQTPLPQQPPSRDREAALRELARRQLERRS